LRVSNTVAKAAIATMFKIAKRVKMSMVPPGQASFSLTANTNCK